MNVSHCLHYSIMLMRKTRIKGVFLECLRSAQVAQRVDLNIRTYDDQKCLYLKEPISRTADESVLVRYYPKKAFTIDDCCAMT